MTDRKWTEEYVKHRFPAEVREQRRMQGKDPDIKPRHTWLRENGHSGIQNYADRQGKTVDDVLLEECGFEPRERKPLPGTHAETKKLIKRWLEDEEDEFGRINDTTVGNTWTYMRRLLEICQDKLGSSNLLRPARAPPGEDVQLTLKIFRGLNEELESEGARFNYGSALDKFYEYLEMIGKVDSNPAGVLLHRMGWTHEREPPEMVPTPKQVRKCWAATETIEEKIIIISLAGCGMRTGDLLIIDAREDVQLKLIDPQICLDDRRKNLQGTVPIIVGMDYLETYIEILDEEEEDWNGALFPSDLSEDGTRSDGWVRARVEEIVERADVTLPDGSKPTPKHFRRFWYNEYLEAYRSYMAMVQDVANVQGSKSARIVDTHYLSSHHERDHFRQYAQAHFETAFPMDIVLSPEEIAEAREEEEDDEDDDGQSSLGDYVGGWLPGVAMAWGSAQITRRRAQREKAAIEYDPRTSMPSAGRAATTVCGLLAFSAVLGVMLAFQGVNLNPAAGPVDPPLTLVAGFVIGAIRTAYLLDDLEEPPDATGV